MLQSRITPVTPNDDAEDVFTSFLPHLFPDEAHSCLGDPGQTLLYASPLYGDVQIMIPGYGGAETSDAAGDEPNRDDNDSQRTGSVEEGRKLFAHYLWGGAMVVAEGVEEADKLERGSGHGDDDIMISRRRKWNVSGQKVLEFGAGAALPSLIAALAGADTVAISDHPSSSAIYGPIQSNISKNISSENIRQRISIHAHEWGVLPSSVRDAGQSEDIPSANLQFATENKGRFTRIICADCLWMKYQHENLVRSILWFLAPPSCHDGSNHGGVAWVVAGFHTGRGVVASFFETAVSMGLVVDDIWERDMNATSEVGEVTREWCPVREEEGPENRARWCVVAFLRKKD